MEKVKDFLIGEDVIVEPRNVLEELKKFFDWELAYRLAFYWEDTFKSSLEAQKGPFLRLKDFPSPIRPPNKASPSYKLL